MCTSCDSKEPTKIDRRRFLTAIASTAGLLAASMPLSARAAPKPENVMTSESALARLMQGNDRYVKGIESPDSFKTTQKSLSKGQNPYACILGCADSRVSPELCFDENQGDLFVTRVAGNYVTPEILASLEYGTAVLKAPLIVVLGHTSCGAINAAIKAVKNDEDFPGHIQKLATDLSPAVENAMKAKPANLELASVKENVLLNVAKLQISTPLLRRMVQNKQLQVVGGVYDLNTGRVELITPI